MNYALIVIGFLMIGIGFAGTLKNLRFTCPFHGAGERSAHAVINNPKDGDHFLIKLDVAAESQGRREG